jgi:pimeloyl-ACP methyl ester carboxylesterase
MIPCIRAKSGLLLIIALSASVYAQIARPGKNNFSIRGQEQKIYLYPGTSAGEHRGILFAPGDAGCRGFAAEIAEQLGKEGYDTYCLDVLHYLESFTGRTILTTDQIASDFDKIARWIEQNDRRPIPLVGWSEGAGLGLAAAASPSNRAEFNGLVVIGVPEENILAWHWKDVGAWITKKAPREPTFKSADLMLRISPLPLFMIGSTSTEWVTPEATRKLFSLAREPKKITIITARDHKYSGNTKAFFSALRQGLDWIRSQKDSSVVLGSGSF